MTPLIEGLTARRLIPRLGDKGKDMNPVRVAASADPLFGRMVAYDSVLAIGTATTISALVYTGHGINSPWPLAALAVTAAVAERGRIQLERGVQMETSVSNLPVLFAAVVLGPLAAAVVGAASLIGAVRWPLMKLTTYAFIRAINGALTGVVAAWSSGFTSNHVGSVALAVGLGGLTVELSDLGFVCLTARLRSKRARPFAAVLFRITLLSVPLYAPLVGLLALAYLRISPWTLPLFLVPALAAQRLFGLYQDQRQLAEDLSVVNRRLERATLSFATALVATLDARDRYTAGHSAAVSIYARDIAARVGLPPEQQQLAHLCGLVHDIGKIGLPPGLLEKSGVLTLEERRQMQEHSAIGERILAKVEDYAEIAKIVRHHHERIDGMGYPDGMAGNEIPLISRIIAVADAYNAMTSDRPYRDAMPSRVARMRLAQGVEGQFDTSIVAAFEAILAGAMEDYRTGSGLDFTLDAQDRYSEAATEQAA
jgi:putative nucleotidyltransferase with HDIG domain